MIANPPKWPNNAKCAVAFSFDVDADSILHNLKRGKISDFQHEIFQMRYDPFVALPRLCEIFGTRNVPVTWFVPGWVIKNYPSQIENLLRYKNEIAHHGFYHESPNLQSFKQEQEALQLGISVIQTLIGKKPVGYRAPYYAVSKNTFDLLITEGFIYDSSLFADDVPLLTDNGHGNIIELPIPASIDDYNQYVSNKTFDYLMKVSSPENALEVFKAEFEAMWQFGGLWVGVWHPAVSGRPAQAQSIVKLIEYMQQKGGVWFATHEEIANHIKGLIARNEWEPRLEKVPIYSKPILD